MSENYNYQSQLPDMPMKGHKFLVYFWLWFIALIAVVGAINNIQLLGQLEEQGSADAVNGLPLVYLQTVLLLGNALYLVKVRFNLAGFKRNAPKTLSTALIVMAAINLINAVIVAMNSGGDDSSIYSAPIMNLATMLAYRRYYNARDHYFVN